jgi:hypothetical protein
MSRGTMKLHRWPIHVCAALALFLGAGVEAQGQEQVASAEAAQEKQPAQPSTLVLPVRVRLRMTDGSRLTGELLRVEEGRVVVRDYELEKVTEAGSVLLSKEQSDKATPLAGLKSAQVSRGKHRHAGKGALIGGLSGLAFVVVNTLGGGGGGESQGAIIGGGLGAMGALLGAGIGALRKTDRWEDIPVSSLTATSPPVKADNELAEVSPDRQVRFAIAPTLDRGVQARLSISWR